MDRHLRQVLIAPNVVALPRAATFTRALILRAYRGVELGMLREAHSEVVLEKADEALTVSKQAVG
jgi:hypothetical protein